MLKSEQFSTVCCPSCGSSLEGEYDETLVRIDEGEMSVSLYCEGCDRGLTLSVGPLPPDGRKVDVTIEERRSQYL